jgi:cytochrome c556
MSTAPNTSRYFTATTKALIPVITIVSMSLISLTGIANAQELKKASSKKQADTVVTFRKSLLQLVRANMGPLGAMAKGNIPMDADTIALNAQRIEFLGGMMHDYFATDTRDFDVNTEAKNDIWTNYDDFSSKADDMVAAASSLQELVANNQEGDYRKGIGRLGGTCKACHDDYKKD